MLAWEISYATYNNLQKDGPKTITLCPGPCDVVDAAWMVGTWEGMNENDNGTTRNALPAPSHRSNNPRTSYNVQIVYILYNIKF